MTRALRAFSGFFLDLTETVVIGLSFFLVVYLFFLQPHQVNGQSMYPNFHSGDYVLTDKVSYRVGEPQRGDVIVFHAPESANCPEGTGCDFIKRIIALPGERVEVRAGKIFVNGQALNEQYLPQGLETEAGNYTENGEILLGPDEFFASGDNRPYSSDSRAWGPVPRENIVGRAFFVYWPIGQIGTIEHPQYSN